MKEVVAEVARLPACRIGCLAMLATVWIVGAGCHRESVITPEPTVVDAVSTDATPVPESHEWTVSELRRNLRHVSAGRSFENGKRVFVAARCDQCHRLNRLGGGFGPDLTGVSGRYSRAVILREIIEPSVQILEGYQTQLILTASGSAHQGVVRGQDAEFLHLANDPDKPTEVLKIALEDIEAKAPVAASTMPTGLINTLTREEILDLLAYIEAGGREGHRVFEPVEE